MSFRDDFSFLLYMNVHVAFDATSCIREYKKDLQRVQLPNLTIIIKFIYTQNDLIELYCALEVLSQRIVLCTISAKIVVYKEKLEPMKCDIVHKFYQRVTRFIYCKFVSCIFLFASVRLFFLRDNLQMFNPFINSSRIFYIIAIYAQDIIEISSHYVNMIANNL